MWIIAAVGVLVVGSGVASIVRSARHRRRQYAQAVELWRRTPPGQRLTALRSLPLNTTSNGPAWYLIGCAHLHEYRTKQAARAFGMAHHADCNLETAALLTFACLKATEMNVEDIVHQIHQTWLEMNRPNIPRREEDLFMLACLESTAGKPPSLPPLARMTWLVVGPASQPQVEQMFGMVDQDRRP